jgi:hypothetical protein
MRGGVIFIKNKYPLLTGEGRVRSYYDLVNFLFTDKKWKN